MEKRKREGSGRKQSWGRACQEEQYCMARGLPSPTQVLTSLSLLQEGLPCLTLTMGGQLPAPLPANRKQEEFPWPPVYLKARYDQPVEPTALIHSGEQVRVGLPRPFRGHT